LLPKDPGMKNDLFYHFLPGRLLVTKLGYEEGSKSSQIEFYKNFPSKYNKESERDEQIRLGISTPCYLSKIFWKKVCKGGVGQKFSENPRNEIC